MGLFGGGAPRALPKEIHMIALSRRVATVCVGIVTGGVLLATPAGADTPCVSPDKVGPDGFAHIHVPETGQDIAVPACGVWSSVREVAPTAARPAQLAKAPAAATGRPTLARGASGDAVRQLQRALRRAGYRVAVDGVYGSATERAVRALQERRHLKVDGVVGARTWAAVTR